MRKLLLIFNLVLFCSIAMAYGYDDNSQKFNPFIFPIVKNATTSSLMFISVDGEGDCSAANACNFTLVHVHPDTFNVPELVSFNITNTSGTPSYTYYFVNFGK